MNIILSARDQKDLHYEVECILRMFLPDVRPRFLQQEDQPSPERLVICTGDGTNRVALELPGFAGEEREAAPTGETPKDREVSVCRMLFRLLTRATGRRIEWGVLTGIRPVKLVRELREQGLSYRQIQERFTGRYLTAPEKAALCVAADQTQRQAIERVGEKDYSLYIAIPFCPSRCSYCSFVSHSIEKTKKLIPAYLDKLEEELIYTAGIARELGLTLQTIYMGGGTPTVLEAEQLDRLLETVDRHFDRSRCREFTVEAGRPDTITREKLAALARGGVDRISVNPQTLNDRVLAAVGRKHTAADFFRAYEDARAFPFTAINVDLIAGLGGDDPDSFRDTLDRVIALEPENITVHTLSLKRGAERSWQAQDLPDGPAVAGMLDFAWPTLRARGYRPYYLYRQKFMSGALENVGWCRPGYASVYNICMMEELHPVLALGAGGITKQVGDGKVKRLGNPKYPQEYLRALPRILEEKRAWKLGLVAQ